MIYHYKKAVGGYAVVMELSGVQFTLYSFESDDAKWESELLNHSYDYKSTYTTLDPVINRPRSIYQCSSKAPRLSGQTSIFGVVSKSLLGIRGKTRILIHRTWLINHH